MLRHQYLWDFLHVTHHNHAVRPPLLFSSYMWRNLRPWDQSPGLPNSKAYILHHPAFLLSLEVPPSSDMHDYGQVRRMFSSVAWKLWFRFCLTDQGYSVGMYGWLSLTHQYFQYDKCVGGLSLTDTMSPGNHMRVKDLAFQQARETL